MKKNLLVLTFITSLSIGFTQLQAEIITGNSIQVEKEITSWNEEFERLVQDKNSNNIFFDDGITECREVKELRGVHLCLSLNQIDMNLALARASSFIEGVAGSKGEVIPHDKPKLLTYLELVGGHDLKGNDLMSFYEAALSACEKSTNDNKICLNTQEKDLFENFLIPKIARNPNFVVITYALNSRMDYLTVVTHEILHAQYFVDKIFRKITDDFWEREVTRADKEDFRYLLSHSYDSSDDYLMKNEFQAYILQFGSEQGRFKILVNKYQESLLQKLKIKGKKPISIH